MTEANDPALVPAYYLSKYIHWDLVIRTGMGYFEGCATKYPSRWRKKDGLKDLGKSLHFINKLIEAKVGPNRLRGTVPSEVSDLPIRHEVYNFAQANSLTDLEHCIVEQIATWRDEADLIEARDMVLLLMDEAQPKPVPASDSNKHAEQVECLVSAGQAVDFAGNTVTDCRYPNCDCATSSLDNAAPK